MKCYFCGKRVTQDTSHKLVDNHDYRICRKCTQAGYWKTSIEVIEHNDRVAEKERR